MHLQDLDDDALLLILNEFSLSELLQLRLISKRLNILILKHFNCIKSLNLDNDFSIHPSPALFPNLKSLLINFQNYSPNYVSSFFQNVSTEALSTLTVENLCCSRRIWSRINSMVNLNTLKLESPIGSLLSSATLVYQSQLFDRLQTLILDLTTIEVPEDLASALILLGTKCTHLALYSDAVAFEALSKAIQLNQLWTAHLRYLDLRMYRIGVTDYSATIYEILQKLSQFSSLETLHLNIFTNLISTNLLNSQPDNFPVFTSVKCLQLQLTTLQIREIAHLEDNSQINLMNLHFFQRFLPNTFANATERRINFLCQRPNIHFRIVGN